MPVNLTGKVTTFGCCCAVSCGDTPPPKIISMADVGLNASVHSVRAPALLLGTRQDIYVMDEAYVHHA